MAVQKAQKWCSECECRVAAEKLIDRQFNPVGLLVFGVFGVVSEKHGRWTCPRCGSTRLYDVSTAKRWCCVCNRYVLAERIVGTFTKGPWQCSKCHSTEITYWQKSPLQGLADRIRALPTRIECPGCGRKVSVGELSPRSPLLECAGCGTRFVRPQLGQTDAPQAPALAGPSRNRPVSPSEDLKEDVLEVVGDADAPRKKPRSGVPMALLVVGGDRPGERNQRPGNAPRDPGDSPVNDANLVVTLAGACPSCGAKFKVPQRAAGKMFRCSKCQAPFIVAGPSVATAPPRSPAVAAPVQAPAEVRHRPCPYCGEEILLAAKKCNLCGEMLGPGRL
jgi:hypothetical protein